MQERLHATQAAFDRVAAEYDGPRGNNAIVQRMRRTMWEVVADAMPVGSRLVDLGCGTGIDAAHFGRLGYDVTATDWSSEMIRKTEARVEDERLTSRVRATHLGLHDLDGLGGGPFDGMYSNLGALNCAPDLRLVATACSRHLRPGGKLFCSVIGRICPWEILYYVIRGRPRRALVRFRSGMTPVGLGDETVWTRYYTPGEFYREFSEAFELTYVRSLGLFALPPYLIRLHDLAPAASELLARVDDRLGDWPVLRSAGDHFLMILTRRD